MEIICIAKKNKDLMEQLEVITKERDVLKDQHMSKDEELTQSKAREVEL